MKTHTIIFSSFIFLCLMTAAQQLTAVERPAAHQQDQLYAEFPPDNDIRDMREKKNMLNRGVQFGGWISPVFIDERTEDAWLTSSITTAKLWLKTYLWNDSYLYVRIKDSFLARLDQKGAYINHYTNLFDLDVAYINMFWNRWYRIEFFIGRKFFILGSGLAYDGRGDGIELNLSAQSFNMKIMCSYIGGLNLLNKNNNPYGLSDKDITDGAKRLFAGGSLGYEFFNQEIYILALGQFDFSSLGSATKSQYLSQYYGLGFQGVIGSGFTYNAEGIYETGMSYVSGTASKRRISAYAAICGLQYYFNVTTRPTISFQYAFGSGDKDRSDYRSPTGNTGELDTGFLYFGTFNGGYALRPLLANIHVFRWGVTLSPLSMIDIIFVKRMSTTFKYSFYIKNRAASPISSGGDAFGAPAPRDERTIGHALDLIYRWKIISDVSIFLTYGLFVPGEAYPEDEPLRHFVMTGTTMSF